MSQERTILVSNKALYNFKAKSLKRRIDMKVVLGITISKTTDEFVIHCANDEYDYDYVSANSRKIIELIHFAYKEVTNQDLTLIQIDAKDIKSVVTQKKEKSSNVNFTKMPKSGHIPIMIFLYGRINTSEEKKQPLIAPGTPPLSKQKELENPKVKWNNSTAKLEDFQILKALGRGSFGKVCLVEHVKNKELYAMKSLKKDILLSQEQVENALQEKQILSSIKHPFLVSLDYCFQTEDRIYFVMSFMRGGELFELLRKFRVFDEER